MPDRELAMKIKNAVIPVAGLGTRLLPSTKSQPKEMLPVGRKPVVQYVVEEFERAGIDRILFVTGRNKTSIEDHFDRDNELIRLLQTTEKHELLEELKFELMDVKFFYTRQSEQRGLGDAIAHAEHFAGEEPFLVGLGDSIICGDGGVPIVARLSDCFDQKRASCVIAFEEVPREEVIHYGIAKPASDGDVFEVLDVVEKPTVKQAPSNLAVAARYIFAPSIFSALRGTKLDKRGELQLTDAIRVLLQRGGKVFGVKLAAGEQRHDIGNFESYFKSFVDFALADKKYGRQLRDYLRQVIR
ncbi:MAG: UTP--glucose-1-phosphate uridylyltransferase [Planctomycetes bacterium]|nr:UTP--glucose-1-phosphate uridylyltransferase [Planctomycetota bacterium]MBM4084260.1 UTP--glucose-1-phosphate uridylyltransferase [Planctomycetota bacterium]